MWWRFEWVNEWWGKHSANVPWAYLDTCSLFEVISPPWDRRSHGLRVCVLCLWVLTACKLPLLGAGRQGGTWVCPFVPYMSWWREWLQLWALVSPTHLAWGCLLLAQILKHVLNSLILCELPFGAINNWDWNLLTGLISSWNMSNFKSSPTCFSLLWS